MKKSRKPASVALDDMLMYFPSLEFNVIDFPWTSSFCVKIPFLISFSYGNIVIGRESWETLPNWSEGIDMHKNSWLLKKYYDVKYLWIRISSEMLICQRVQRCKRHRCPLSLISTWQHSVGWRKSWYLGLFITKLGRNCSRKGKLESCLSDFLTCDVVSLLISIFP